MGLTVPGTNFYIRNLNPFEIYSKSSDNTKTWLIMIFVMVVFSIGLSLILTWQIKHKSQDSFENETSIENMKSYYEQ